MRLRITTALSMIGLVLVIGISFLFVDVSSIGRPSQNSAAKHCKPVFNYQDLAGTENANRHNGDQVWTNSNLATRPPENNRSVSNSNASHNNNEIPSVSTNRVTNQGEANVGTQTDWRTFCVTRESLKSTQMEAHVAAMWRSGPTTPHFSSWNAGMGLLDLAIKILSDPSSQIDEIKQALNVVNRFPGGRASRAALPYLKHDDDQIRELTWTYFGSHISKNREEFVDFVFLIVNSPSSMKLNFSKVVQAVKLNVTAKSADLLFALGLHFKAHSPATWLSMCGIEIPRFQAYDDTSAEIERRLNEDQSRKIGLYVGAATGSATENCAIIGSMAVHAPNPVPTVTSKMSNLERKLVQDRASDLSSIAELRSLGTIAVPMLVRVWTSLGIGEGSLRNKNRFSYNLVELTVLCESQAVELAPVISFISKQVVTALSQKNVNDTDLIYGVQHCLRYVILVGEGAGTAGLEIIRHCVSIGEKQLARSDIAHLALKAAFALDDPSVIPLLLQSPTLTKSNFFADTMCSLTRFRFPNDESNSDPNAWLTWIQGLPRTK